jgi:hypothetical protein
VTQLRQDTGLCGWCAGWPGAPHGRGALVVSTPLLQRSTGARLMDMTPSGDALDFLLPARRCNM